MDMCCPADLWRRVVLLIYGHVLTYWPMELCCPSWSLWTVATVTANDHVIAMTTEQIMHTERCGASRGKNTNWREIIYRQSSRAANLVCLWTVSRQFVYNAPCECSSLSVMCVLSCFLIMSDDVSAEELQAEISPTQRFVKGVRHFDATFEVEGLVFPPTYYMYR